MKKKKPVPKVPPKSFQSRLSPNKKLMFRIILVLIPISAFLILELFLRYISYGGNLDLVIKEQLGGKEYYVINRKVTSRYFKGTGTISPEPASDVFEINKSDSTKRIFCLGESTMAGFPYPLNSRVSGFMRERLKDLFPHSKIEVVNIGVSAISSYIVLDFIKELIHYKPDLFIVYLGHNEFYGIYGAGSSIRVPGGRWLTNLNISLLKFKTYLLLRDVLASVQRIFSNNSKQDITLMGRMVKEQYIPYGSGLYEAAKDAYRDNLESIITVAQSHQVPILFSELVSNVKDLPPFHSLFSGNITPEQQEQWQSLKITADSLFAVQRYQDAKELYEKCIRLDSLNASAFYYLGKTDYELGQFDIAGTLLNKAKDLDALRFRASEEFKQILNRVCEAKGVPLAPVDSVFRLNSQYGIVGKDLILEHLHPNIKGYSIMAKVFTQKIVDTRLLGKVDSLTQSKMKDDDYYILSSGATQFDDAVGRVTIELLTHKWPFTTNDLKYNFKPQNEIERIAYRYIEVQLTESKARYELADYFWLRKEYDFSHQECYAITKIKPYSYQPYLKLADYYRIEGDREAAKETYLQSIETEDNPFARSKIAIMFLEENQPEQAAINLEACFQIAEKPGMVLSKEAAAASHYLLGVAYSMLGKLSPAREQLMQSLFLNPRVEKARILLRQIEQQLASQ